MSTSVSKFQKFEVETISRDKIKGAEYNPRSISKDARKRLKTMLSRHGLVTTLIWNKQTGNLVSGHQRLNILDELEKSQNYSLNVSVIDVDLQTEKKLNVQLNNPSMQGDWSVEDLTTLIDESALNPFDLGFNDSDVSILFGEDSSFTDMLTDAPEVEDAKESIKKIKEHRQEASENMKEKANIDNYFVIVCNDSEQKRVLLKRLGVPDYEQYVNGQTLAAELKV